MTKQFTLGKNERLKSRKLIEQLFSDGKKFTITPFRIHYLFNKTEQLPALRFGVGVSNKNFKKAVDRNRIKRLAREAYRLQKKTLQEMVTAKNLQLNIFFIYTGKEIPAYKDVFDKTNKTLNKLIEMVDSAN